VIDGEIVIDGADGRQDFDALSQRIHPAASRIELLSREKPARFIAFDLLAREDEVLMERPFAERRAALEALVQEPLKLAPSVQTAAEAEDWLRSTEGVVAKLLDAPYEPGKRTAMVKVKRVRTIDCVVVGWRPGKEEGTVGSLILGLYDADGELKVVGHTSGFRGAEKHELVARLAPYETGERGSADPSRWKSDKELEWVALRPELVVEISFEQVSGRRIRHGTKLLRWREDKAPRDCGIGQLAG
jgi:ATP-dependent DNA ligase